MKLLRLVILSALILCVTFLLQNVFDGGRGPGAGPSLAHRSSDNGLTTSPIKPILSGQPTPTPSPLPAGPLAVSPIEPTPTSASPRVVAYEPSPNALLCDLHTPLVFTFDRAPVGSHQSSVITGHQSLIADHSLLITPAVQGQVTWRDRRTLVFAPAPGWAPGTRYEVRLGDDFRTRFRTGHLVERFSPARSSTVDPRTVFAVEFGLAVDQASVERAFTISPTVPGRASWINERHFVFEPDYPLDYVTTYHVGFSGELLDLAGMSLAPDQDWSFTTRSAVLGAGPTGNVNIDKPILIRFGTAVDHASVEAALVVTPSIAGSFEWQENTLTFRPDDFLNPNTTYSVTLRALVLDASGQSLLDSDYGWHFQTGPIPHVDIFGYGPNIQLLDADGRRAVSVNRYSNGRMTLRLYALDVTRFLDLYISSFRGVGPGEDRPVQTDDLLLHFTWDQQRQQGNEVIVPDSVPPGLYVLEAQSGAGRDQLIVGLTRHALVLKQAERQIVTWASTLSDHAPAAGMHLRFYDRDGTLLAEGVTEGRGLFRTVVPVDTEPLIVVGELDGDVTVSGLGLEWRVGDDWWGWWKTSPSAPDAIIYPYTDRPIYRPGQTVHARAVLRRDDDAVYSLPDGVDVVLRLRDARDNVVTTRQRTPDEFGVVYADFEIADGGTVGTYHLEVSALGESTRQPFLVEAYRKPDYEVTLTPATEHAVAGARVEVVPYVAGYDEWYETELALDYGYAHEQLRRSGQTDAEGRFTVVLPARVTNEHKRQKWNIEATVTDASDLSVSAHTRVVVHRAALGLSLHTECYHYHPGDPIPVTLLARDQYGVTLSGVELSVGLYAWDRNARAYGRPVVETRTTSAADGGAEATLQTWQSGWYELRATGSDGAGHEVQAQQWLLVWGGDGWMDADAAGELRLSTDRDRYAPGDSVSLLIESPLNGPALLSFERGTTRRETVIQLEQGVNTLSFELLPDDVPNVYVAVAAWRPTRPGDEQWRWMSRPEQELLTARTEILVPADDRRLSVTITPDHSQYAPRDEAVFLVEVRDHAGQPVRAGFSLALVDEAIFALAADQTPDIFDAFYRPRPDIVRTYHSLRPTRWIDGGLGGGGGGGDLANGGPRSDFPDTAYWAPALTTGADGKAWVRVPLPDSLTRWRAVVRAVTADTRVGQATAGITVALPLSIQPVLPRFLVQGDQATLTAVVHNHTGLTQTATVRLTLTGLELGAAQTATQQVTLPANGTVAAGWPVVASELGQASVRVDVALDGPAGGGPWHDAVELPLPVLPLAIPKVDTVTAEVGNEWVETIKLPDAAILDVSRWELAFAPSIAIGMLDGLEFLIDYPFG